MIPGADELLRAAGLTGPWLALALLLLGIAARVARSAQRSARAQGERLGVLERSADSERTRRRQVEALLTDMGVPLPYWPPDGPGQPRPRRRHVDEDLADLEDEDQQTAIRDRVPVPPLPPDLGARYRRHAAP